MSHGASNEWVVAGSRSDTGKPILANDPHLELGAPILWYLARIVTPEVSIKGGTIPGSAARPARPERPHRLGPDHLRHRRRRICSSRPSIPTIRRST